MRINTSFKRINVLIKLMQNKVSVKLFLSSAALLFTFLSYGKGKYNILNSQDTRMQTNNLNNARLYFEENKGQVKDFNGNVANNVLFVYKTNDLTIHITTKGISYVFNKPLDQDDNISDKSLDHITKDPQSEKKFKWELVELLLLNANINKNNIQKFDQSPSFFNYYDQNNIHGIKSVYGYKQVRISNIYPGINWILNIGSNGEFKYDFEVTPGASRHNINICYQSLKKPNIDKDGNLVINTSCGTFIEQKPLSYYSENSKSEIETNFKIVSTQTTSEFNKNDVFYKTSLFYQFESEHLDSTKNLIIDPLLVWGTNINNTVGGDIPYCVNTDSQNNLFICGYISLGVVNFPLTAPAGHYFQGTINGVIDAYMLKFSSTGVLIWGTLLGGSLDDMATGIEFDNNSIVLVGQTTSMNFPTLSTGGSYLQATHGGGGWDGFIVKFNPSGAMQFSTYYGGNDWDLPRTVDIDPSGNIFVAGFDKSTNMSTMPVAGSYNQNTRLGVQDGFIWKFNSNGVRQWATYFGGALTENYLRDLEIAPNNDLIIVGDAVHIGISTPSFPIQNLAGALNYSISTSRNMFISRFTNTGTLIWSTPYGNNGVPTFACGVECDQSGNIFVAGSAFGGLAQVIPPGAYSHTITSAQFSTLIMKFSPVGALTWLTYDAVFGFSPNLDCIDIDPCGNVYLTAHSVQSSMAQAGAPNAMVSACGFDDNTLASLSYETYIMKFSNDCKKLWDTFLGGTQNDMDPVVGADNLGNCYVANLRVGINPNIVVLPGAYNDNTSTSAAMMGLFKFSGLPPVLNKSQVNSNACICTGAASVSICGDLPYSYVWSTGLTVLNTTVSSSSINSLCPGVYQVTVTSGCTFTNVETFTITSSTSNQTVNTTVQNANCISPTGTLIINSVTNGIPNYTLAEGTTTLASGFNTPYSLTNVSVGTHTYVLTSSNGCSTTFTAQILPGGSPPNISAIGPVTLNCVPNNTTIIASTTSTAALTYTWSGPGILSGANTLTATVNQPGTYTIIAAQGSCTNTATVSVVANTNTPNISISTPAVLNCTNTSVVLTATSTTSGVTYSWSGGPFSSTYTVSLPLTYTLTVTNPTNGCTSQSVVSVSQNTTAPNVSAGNNQTLTCAVSAVTLTGSSTTSGATFTWSPLNVNTNTAVATIAGNYTFTVTDPNNGCVNTATVSVVQNGATPTITAVNNLTLNCINTSVNLNATSAGNTIVWNGGSLVNASNPQVVSSPGNYTATATNITSGCSSSTIITVTQNTVAPVFSAVSSNSLNCSFTSATLTASSSNPNLTYQWSSGPNSYTYTVFSPSNYTVTATDPSNGCTNTATVAVSQSTTQPNVTASSSNSLNCILTSATLTASSTNTNVTYQWTSGPNTYTYTISLPLTYTVTATDPTNGCSSQAIVIVPQSTLAPNVSITNQPTLTCANQSAVLQGTSTTSGAIYQWSGGPSSYTYTIFSPSNYTLTVTDPSNGCSSQATVNVIQNGNLPNISINVPAILNCTNTSVVLTGTSTTSGVNYQWSGGPLNSYTYTVSSPGSYSLTVLDPISGCSSSSVITVTQNTVTPAFSAVSSNSLNCILTSATLTASSSNPNLTYQWTGGPSSYTYTVFSPSNYTVTATDVTNGCSSSSVITVNQNILQPIVTASTSNHLGCNNNAAVLTASSTTSGLNYQWTGGPSSNTYTVSLPLNYTVTATDPSNGCTNTAIVSVSATPMFTANVNVLSQINCFGDNNGVLQINNLGGGSSPFTIVNLNNSNTLNNITNFPVTLNNLSAGSYSIEVSDANGCKQILFSSINQPTQLNVSVAGNSTLCAGNSASITSNASGGTAPYTFNWAPGGGSNPNITVTPNVNTTYTLTVTDNNGCSSSANIAIIVSPKPNASIINNGLVGCAPVCASFSLTQAQGAGYNYNWQFNSAAPTTTAISVNEYNPQLCFTTPGTYNATILITTPQGCSSTVNYTNLVTVYPRPTADFYFTPEKPHILDAPDVNFFNQSTGATSYQWYNVNTMFSTQANPTYIYQDAGTFLVTLIASNPQCSDTISKYIVVEDEFFLFIPNSFTPNGDNLNDTFYPVMSGPAPKAYSFMIFDRWGELLYKSDNPNETQWNGFYKSELCKDDTYVWKLNYTSSKGKAKELTGHVVLMK